LLIRAVYVKAARDQVCDLPAPGATHAYEVMTIERRYAK
jgi:hypothetical protein